jgi:bacteriocin-like protein
MTPECFPIASRENISKEIPVKNRQKAHQRNQKGRPKPASQPQAELTEEQLQQVMGGVGTTPTLPPSSPDEVVVAFESGDPRRPYVTGALWNG